MTENNEPVMSAYPDEQTILDANLEEEVKLWKEIKDLLTSRGYELRTKLVDGLPHLDLIKTK
jgi:hypothetical protein